MKGSLVYSVPMPTERLRKVGMHSLALDPFPEVEGLRYRVPGPGQRLSVGGVELAEGVGLVVVTFRAGAMRSERAGVRYVGERILPAINLLGRKGSDGTH